MEITLQNVKRRFSQWRASKKTDREKIPEDLLKLASACGFKFGYSVTLMALNLSTLKLNLAMKTYPDKIENEELKKPNTNKIISDAEFFEVKFPQNEFETESSIQNTKEEFKLQPVLYELENKFGVKMRVYSESEHLQKNIFTAFSLGG